MINVSNNFHEKARGQIIWAVASIYISFLKNKAENVDFFTLDTSILNGNDILKSTEDNPIQLWDTYDYHNYTDRLVSVEVERSIEFPYGTQLAQADFVLDNTDQYFTIGRGSAIEDYNLPRRPIRVYGGFKGAENIAQFVGLTQGMVSINEHSATAEYHAVDFLSEIANQTLNNTIAMRNARTNEVLAEIVEQFGVLPSQYNFEQGDNVIPFVFFDKGQNAGEAIKQLIQAEGGKFWLDETGILRFQRRVALNTQPVMTIPEYSIINVRPSGEDTIINHVKITCDLREVQEFQTVFAKGNTSGGDMWVIGANSSIVRECRLENPCYDVVEPTQGRSSSVSWFTAVNELGEEVPSNITASGELSTNAYTITFTNSNAFPVKIAEVQLWGEPAKVYDVLDYDVYDSVSVEKYGEQVLEIADNQFFQSYSQAQSFGSYMLRERANFNQVLTVDIKGDFSLQLGDSIELEGDFAGNYRIDAISWRVEAGNYKTTIKCHKFEPVEYFTLDVSILDGTDILG